MEGVTVGDAVVDRGPIALRASRGRGRTLARLVLLSALVGVLAACGAGADQAGARRAGLQPGGSGPGGATASEPLLVVDDVGGFVAPQALFNRLPRIYVTADARLITPGPMILIYPGPALPNLREQALDADAVASLRALATAAGIDQPPPDYGTPRVADATTTEVTYRAADGRTYVHQAYALGLSDDGLTDAQRNARDQLQRFVESAGNSAALGPGVGPDRPYAVVAFVVRAAPVDGAQPSAGDPATGATSATDGAAVPHEPRPTVQAWPVESVRLAQSGVCTPVTGPDAETLRDALGQANQLTQWSQDGQVYAVSVRPSLPGEGLCR
jgi:hypothetical protein